MCKKALVSVFLSTLTILIIGCTKPIGPEPGDTISQGKAESWQGYSDPSRPGGDGSIGGDSLNPDSVDGSSIGSFNMGGGLEERNTFGAGSLVSIDEGNFVRGQLSSVYFGFDQSFVAQNERYKLQEVANYVKSNPNSKIIIEGYCDWRGTTEYNMSLGDRRARSCQQILISMGVSSSSLEILSKGDQEAISGGTASEMAEDRRAEFVIVKQ